MARARKPAVFISHSEGDKAIASYIAQFIKSESGNRISVFLSSDPRFKTVRMGEEISVEVGEAIADCDVFLFVYTRKDVDWSWCMFEWGMASHPSSAKSTMIVFQCGSDEPKIHAARRRVDLRVREDVYEFVKQYLTSKQVFRSGKAVADHPEDIIKEKANLLFEGLAPLIRDIDPPVQTSTWPYLQISVPLETVQKITSETSPLDTEAQLNLLKESAKILKADEKVLNVFGRIGLAHNVLLSKIARSVTGITGRRHTLLLDCCCQQIAEASADTIPSIRTVTVQGLGQGIEFVPVVTKVQRVGYLRTVLFDLYLLSRPAASSKSVSEAMLRHFYWKLWDTQLEQSRLVDISKNMKKQKKNRLPVLDENEVIRYVIHRASINEFIVANLSRADQLTMHDLLADERMRATFEQSFAFIAIDDSLEQARAKITKKVRDVFVTQTGSPQETVRGWLTDVDLASEVPGSVR